MDIRCTATEGAGAYEVSQYAYQIRTGAMGRGAWGVFGGDKQKTIRSRFVYEKDVLYSNITELLKYCYLETCLSTQDLNVERELYGYSFLSYTEAQPPNYYDCIELYLLLLLYNFFSIRIHITSFFICDVIL